MYKKSVLRLVISAAAIGYFILFPQSSSTAITDGLKLCAQIIIPSMFPYFVVTEFLIRSGGIDIMAEKLRNIMPRIFRVSGHGAAPLLAGLIGGYPLGAKTISALLDSNRISKKEAERLTTFCCNTGPAFIIGAVGSGLYRSAAVGMALYGIHILSAVLCGLTGCGHFTAQTQTITPPIAPECSSNTLVQSVCSAAETMLKVCSFILTFMLPISAVKRIIPHNTPLLYPLLGLVELSAGCTELAAATIPWTVKFTATSAILAFGGLCVFLQSCSVFPGDCFPVRSYLTGKLKQSAFSAILAFPLSFLIRPDTPTSTFFYRVSPVSPFPYSILPLFLLLAIFLQFSTGNSHQVRL